MSMAHDTHVYGEVKSATGLKKVFREIRRDVAHAHSRPDLTELYKRAGYLITLTYSPAWDEKWGKDASKLRTTAKAEFSSTARKINRRARQVGSEADYDEKWGK
jgi:hypothetical protein